MQTQTVAASSSSWVFWRYTCGWLDLQIQCQASRRGSQRAISAIHEKDVKIPFREKDKASLTLDFRPNTSQTLYNTDKRNDTPQSVSRQSASLVPLSIAHRPSTALSAKTATTPNLLLSGSGITPRKTERLELSGNETNPITGGHLDLSRQGSGPLEEIMQVATRWNPMYSQLTRGKIYKNLQGGEWINEPVYLINLD